MEYDEQGSPDEPANENLGRDDRMGRVFRLVEVLKDQDTKETLQKLLKESESGDLVGAVVIPMYRRKGRAKHFKLCVTGWASENPTLAAGAISACLVLITELSLQDAGLL